MVKKQLKWFLLFFLALLVFVWIVQFNGLYGQDSYEYLRYTKALVRFIKTGASPGDYFWPMLYPITGTFFSFLFPLPFALQLIAILSLILSAVYLEKILILLFGAEKNAAMLYVLLFFLLSPYMLRGSLVIMSDSLASLCIASAVYHFEQYKRTLTNTHFLWLVFFFAAAISTRYAAFIVLLPFMLFAVFIFFKNFKLLPLFASVGIVFLLFLPHLIIRSHSPFQFINHEWISTWSPINMFRNQFNTSDGHSSYLLANIAYAFFNVFHPAFCFAGMILFIACLWPCRAKWNTSAMWPFIISILLYAVFMAGIPFQDLRYLLLPFPLILILLFPGFESIKRFLNAKKMWNYCLILILVIQLGLFCRVFMPFYNDNKTEKSIAEKMLKYPGKTLCTFSIDDALRGYGFKGKIINMCLVRMDTIKRIDTNLLVLFNEAEFSKAWKDKNPMINWEFLNTRYQLVKIEDMPAGWGLYSEDSTLK